MNRTLRSLLVIAGVAVTAAAQQPEKPFTVKASILSPFAETKTFLGGKSTGLGVEFGYDWRAKDNFATLTPWIGYATFTGNDRAGWNEANATNTPGASTVNARYDLKVLHYGVDLKFDLPWMNAKWWMGLSLKRFYGENKTGGAIPVNAAEAYNGAEVVVLTAGKLGETKPKLGARVGVDVPVGKDFSVHAQYDFAPWVSDSEAYKQRYVDALNPLNPSWFSVSVGYRF